jgi:DNA-binding transcriptional LysR family regulator
MKNLDLNLLIVFNELFKRRSVSAVASSINLTQPAVSNALRRLRESLNDELFVKTSRGMVPTPFALQFAEPIAYALNSIQSTLDQNINFDPLSSSRTFNVAMSDIGEIYFIPILIKHLSEIAPNINIRTYRTSGEDLKEKMEDGEIDLAVGLLPDLKSGFFQRRLFNQKYVCLTRSGQEYGKKLSLKKFLEADHVAIDAVGTGHSEIETILNRMGYSRNIVMHVPHFVAVGHILSASNLIATVPEKFADCCTAPFNLTAYPHPIDLPSIMINIFWHGRFHKEAGNQWLRSVFADLFAENEKP